ncbi:hypothetical protein HX13_17560 [Chryseobacterium sp. P1-3]|uniref:Uncharacterized protein n=1 Tax=Chryseobacterium gallinarum TaxID=1324352 RepID=A0A0G3M2P1_CHRGL|nr:MULTISPECIES: hypothetical protein [Chryseobacterium]AKK73446.1 hypothetical protein OK18_13285 [Chryseobacterium gallinarum]KFF73815.1 hypothetical protein HX13_17560 [Chryseobacterium sp. P1-3]MCL8537172.1 hypothetical protein [Chryseobacterium gallinarum]QIY90747.1 hypothetical protein FOB44_08740 [Chryseobacterium gallinarum]
MKSLLIVWTAILISCTSTPSHTLAGTQNNAEILVSEAQGGTDQMGFRIIKDEKDFRNTIKGSFGIIGPEGDGSYIKYPQFPKNKKVVLYNLGTFRSGSHTIEEIKSVSVKNKILYVEVPAGAPSGGMEIQVISNPWFIFTVPADYQFTSVELKYSK